MDMITLLKREKCNLFTFICHFAISLFIILECHIFYDVNIKTNMSISGQNQYSLFFRVDSDRAWDFSFLQNEKSHFALLRKVSDASYIYNIEYSHLFFENSSGEYMDEELQSYCNGNYFIYGEKTNSIIDISNFIYGGCKYKALEKISNQNSLSQIYGIFLLTPQSEYYGENTFIIEANDSETTYKIINLIKSNLSEAGCDVIVLDIDDSTIGSEKYLQAKEINYIGVILISFMVGIVCLVMQQYVWLGQYNQEIITYKILGKRMPCEVILLKYIVITLLAHYLAYLVLRIGAGAKYSFDIALIYFPLSLLSLCASFIIKQVTDYD